MAASHGLPRHRRGESPAQNKYIGKTDTKKSDVDEPKRKANENGETGPYSWPATNTVLHLRLFCFVLFIVCVVCYRVSSIPELGHVT